MVKHAMTMQPYLTTKCSVSSDFHFNSKPAVCSTLYAKKIKGIVTFSFDYILKDSLMFYSFFMYLITTVFNNKYQ